MTDWRLPSSLSSSDNDGSSSKEPPSSLHTSKSDNSIATGDSQRSGLDQPDTVDDDYARFRPKGNSGVTQTDRAFAESELISSSESLSGYHLESVTTLQRQPLSSGIRQQQAGSEVEPETRTSYDDRAFRRPETRASETPRPERSEQPELRNRAVTGQSDTRWSAAPHESVVGSTEPIYQRVEQPVPTYSDSFFQPETPPQRAVDPTFTARAGAAASAVSSLASVYQSADAAPRVQSVRRSLDDALEAWWTESAVPPKALLRNGLLVLEAGHSLDEAHRTLLLRTALRHQRGMVTALSHQTDPDRTAYLLKEALLFEKSPLSPQILWHLQREDADSEEWKFLLEDDLLFNIDSFNPSRQRLATAAIHQLSSSALLSSSELDSEATIVTRTAHSMSWSIGRLLLALLLIPMIIGVNALRSERADLTGMATIPAGNYVTGQLAFGVEESNFYVEAFALEQIEVTNQSYRLCMQQGDCLPPTDVSSATRPQYFLNPLYDRYPVVNVSWTMAQQYCEWAGKRLPTVVEWEIAASASPATERRFDYPWGNEFLQQYANSQLADIQDTKEVGTYHPAGTSQTGATDMAGNVAEWTDSHQFIPAHRLRVDQPLPVKGGSYIDAPEKLRASDSLSLAANEAKPWLGFRCAITLPKEKEEETN